MNNSNELAGLDRAITDLDARVTALAAAVVHAAALDLASEVAHLFDDAAEVDVTMTHTGADVHVKGAAPVLREFGSRHSPARPWVASLLDRTVNRITPRGAQ